MSNILETLLMDLVRGLQAGENGGGLLGRVQRLVAALTTVPLTIGCPNMAGGSPQVTINLHFGTSAQTTVATVGATTEVSTVSPTGASSAPQAAVANITPSMASSALLEDSQENETPTVEQSVAPPAEALSVKPKMSTKVAITKMTADVSASRLAEIAMEPTVSLNEPTVPHEELSIGSQNVASVAKPVLAPLTNAPNIVEPMNTTPTEAPAEGLVEVKQEPPSEELEKTSTRTSVPSTSKPILDSSARPQPRKITALMNLPRRETQTGQSSRTSTGISSSSQSSTTNAKTNESSSVSFSSTQATGQNQEGNEINPVRPRPHTIAALRNLPDSARRPKNGQSSIPSTSTSSSYSTTDGKPSGISSDLSIPTSSFQATGPNREGNERNQVQQRPQKIAALRNLPDSARRNKNGQSSIPSTSTSSLSQSSTTHAKPNESSSVPSSSSQATSQNQEENERNPVRPQKIAALRNLPDSARRAKNGQSSIPSTSTPPTSQNSTTNIQPSGSSSAPSIPTSSTQGSSQATDRNQEGNESNPVIPRHQKIAALRNLPDSARRNKNGQLSIPSTSTPSSSQSSTTNGQPTGSSSASSIPTSSSQGSSRETLLNQKRNERNPSQEKARQCAVPLSLRKDSAQNTVENSSRPSTSASTLTQKTGMNQKESEVNLTRPKARKITVSANLPNSPQKIIKKPYRPPTDAAAVESTPTRSTKRSSVAPIAEPTSSSQGECDDNDNTECECGEGTGFICQATDLLKDNVYDEPLHWIGCDYCGNDPIGYFHCICLGFGNTDQSHLKEYKCNRCEAENRTTKLTQIVGGDDEDEHHDEEEEDEEGVEEEEVDKMVKNKNGKRPARNGKQNGAPKVKRTKSNEDPDNIWVCLSTGSDNLMFDGFLFEISETRSNIVVDTDGAYVLIHIDNYDAFMDYKNSYGSYDAENERRRRKSLGLGSK